MQLRKMDAAPNEMLDWLDIIQPELILKRKRYSFEVLVVNLRK